MLSAPLASPAAACAPRLGLLPAPAVLDYAQPSIKLLPVEAMHRGMQQPHYVDKAGQSQHR
jgi:hypothetical protein